MREREREREGAGDGRMSGIGQRSILKAFPHVVYPLTCPAGSVCVLQRGGETECERELHGMMSSVKRDSEDMVYLFMSLTMSDPLCPPTRPS